MADDPSEIYEAAGKQYNIDPLLLRSMGRVEGGERTFDDRGNLITSPAGARGWMQFTGDTARRYGVDVTDMRSSIFGAAHYMSDLLDQTNGNLPASLAIYNGSQGDRSQTYAKQILGNYQQVQKQQQAELREAGQTSTAQPTPGVIEVSASGQTPPQPGINTSGRVGKAPANEFEGTLYGTQPGPAAPSAAAPANDFSGTLYGTPKAPETPTVVVKGKAPEQPAQPPAIVAPAEAAPRVTPPVVPVQEETPPPAATPPPPAAPPPAAPPTWLQRNVTAPISAMLDPTQPQPPQNYLMGVPLAQSMGAGYTQGARDIAQTINNASAWADRNAPWLNALDQWAAAHGLISSPTASNLPAQTAAFQQQYGSDIPAQGARIAGQMAGTSRIVAPLARAAGAVAEASPVVARILAPAAAGAVSGGTQNALVSGGTGENPLTAFTQGAIGGGTIGGVLGGLGARLSRPANAAEQAIADRLGIRLSAGQRAGGIVKRVEDATSIVPLSGAARFAQEQRGQIAQVIAREGGIPGPVQHINGGMVAQALDNASTRVENAAQNVTIPQTALLPRLLPILQAAQQAGPHTQQAYTARNLVSQLTNLMRGGDLPGPVFRDFIRRGGALDTALGSGTPEVQTVGNAIKRALLDAGQAGGQGSQQALRDLTEGRYQMKVLLTVRNAISKTQAGTEEMSLPNLASAIEREFGFAPPGPGMHAAMPELAQLIRGPLRTLASSGTAERSLLYDWLGLTGAGAPSGLLWALGHPQAAENTAWALGGPMAASALASRLSRFGPGMGINPLEAAWQLGGPLAPRLFGPNVGNALNPPPAPP